MSGSSTPPAAVTVPGVAVFDYAAWSALYPALAQSVGAGQAQGYYDLACLYLDNTPTSLVRDLDRRAALLGLLVAQATRGSVSVRTEFATLSERAAWFGQTQYGASFWAATRGLRQARYVPGLPQRPAIWP